MLPKILHSSWSKFFYFRISWILMEWHCFFVFLSPPLCAGPQKPQKLTASKIEYENFWPKNLDFLLKIRYFGALISQELELFDHYKHNSITSCPQKILIFKILLNSMIKLFLSLKSKVDMAYFSFLLLRPCTKWRGWKK